MREVLQKLTMEEIFSLEKTVMLTIRTQTRVKLVAEQV